MSSALSAFAAPGFPMDGAASAASSSSASSSFTAAHPPSTGALAGMAPPAGPAQPPILGAPPQPSFGSVAAPVSFASPPAAPSVGGFAASRPIGFGFFPQPAAGSAADSAPFNPFSPTLPATVTAGAFAGMALPAGPARPSIFGAWPPPTSTSASGLVSVGFFSPVAAASPSAHSGLGSAGSAGVSSLTPPLPFAAPASVTPTKKLSTKQLFVTQLTAQLRTREGVFALNWHEHATPTDPTLLMRYLISGPKIWAHELTQSGLDQAHSWIVEKLEAELADGHGYDHETRDPSGDAALHMLLKHWLTRPQLVLSMSRVLLASPSVAARFRADGARQEIPNLAAILTGHLSMYPDRVAVCVDLLGMIVERGGSFHQALLPIVEDAHIDALLRLIKTGTAEQLRSIPSSTLLKRAQELEQQCPYQSHRRLCRELIERVCEGALAESSSSSASASSSAAASSSLSSSSSILSAWLSDFESALPRRLLAHRCAVSDDAKLLRGALPQFDWLDLAEESLHARLMRSEAIRSATLERVKQLAARERARAADEPLSPSEGPLSTPAILAHLICQSIQMMGGVDPTGSLLRELLSAATAPVFAASFPSSPFGLCIPSAFDSVLRLPAQQQMRAVMLFHGAGISGDTNGSFTLQLIRSGYWATLQRWLSPANAHLAMPLGWLGERDPMLPKPLSAPLESSARHAQAHPHLAADWRCDVWAAVCRRDPQHTTCGLLVQHAIEWHYATVTPRLREALSPHLISDLHAEVQSWLMPPSTLQDPVPATDVRVSPPYAMLDSVIRTLPAEFVESTDVLRCVQQHLHEAAVSTAFAERALAAERRLAELTLRSDL